MTRKHSVEAVAIVAVVPPPVTGMTIVSAHIAAVLCEAGSGRPYTFSRPAWLSSLLWPLWRQARLLGRLFQAIVYPAESIYFVLDSGAGIWVNLLVHAPLLRASGKRVIFHHHVFSYLHGYDLRIALIAQLLKDRALHVVLCPGMEQQMRKLYRGVKHVSIVDNAFFAANGALGIERGRLRRVGFLGNISLDKGIDTFIAVVQELVRLGVDMEADIAGPIADANIQATVAAFVAADPTRRRYLGHVYGSSKLEFLAGIDALLFPSRYRNEAQPVTIFEALAAGAPVLATARGCIPAQLPERWTFAEKDFLDRSVSTLLDWTADPANYQAEVHLGQAVFRAAVAASTEQVARLLRQLGSRAQDGQAT